MPCNCFGVIGLSMMPAALSEKWKARVLSGYSLFCSLVDTTDTPLFAT